MVRKTNRRSLLKTKRTKRQTRKQQKGGDPTLLIKKIVHYWKKHYGYVSFSPPQNPNNYYLNCTETDDFNNHIHIIVDSGRYIYKREGKQDNANKKGFGFEYGGKWCVEDGASPEEWEASEWAEFLNNRLCYSGDSFGRCQK